MSEFGRDITYKLMIRLIKIWSRKYMDQWEKFKFTDESGRTTYVTIAMKDV